MMKDALLALKKQNIVVFRMYNLYELVNEKTNNVVARLTGPNAVISYAKAMA